MGTMRMKELSVAGKIFIFFFSICLIGGLYYGYITYKYNNKVDEGNILLNNGDYDKAIALYQSALQIKSFKSTTIEINSLIKNAKTLKESEISQLNQDIIAIIGDRYSGIEGSNIIAIRKGYYSAVEIDKVQKKIDRLKVLGFDKEKLNVYQSNLNRQKNIIKYKSK